MFGNDRNSFPNSGRNLFNPTPMQPPPPLPPLIRNYTTYEPNRESYSTIQTVPTTNYHASSDSHRLDSTPSLLSSPSNQNIHQHHHNQYSTNDSRPSNNSIFGEWPSHSHSSRQASIFMPEKDNNNRHRQQQHDNNNISNLVVCSTHSTNWDSIQSTLKESSSSPSSSSVFPRESSHSYLKDIYTNKSVNYTPMSKSAKADFYRQNDYTENRQQDFPYSSGSATTSTTTTTATHRQSIPPDCPPPPSPIRLSNHDYLELPAPPLPPPLASNMVMAMSMAMAMDHHYRDDHQLFTRSRHSLDQQLHQQLSNQQTNSYAKSLNTHRIIDDDQLRMMNYSNPPKPLISLQQQQQLNKPRSRSRSPFGHISSISYSTTRRSSRDESTRRSYTRSSPKRRESSDRGGGGGHHRERDHHNDSDSSHRRSSHRNSSRTSQSTNDKEMLNLGFKKLQREEVHLKQSSSTDRYRLLKENQDKQERILQRLKQLGSTTITKTIAKSNSRDRRSSEARHSQNHRKRVEKSSRHDEKVEKSTKIDENNQKAKETKKINYRDAGNHWCEECNITTSTLSEYLRHLKTPEHLKKLGRKIPPWVSDNPVIVHGTKEEAMKGAEFLVPADAFYCELCEIFMGDMTEADIHMKSQNHNDVYNKHTDKYPSYAKTFLKRMREAQDKKMQEEKKKKEKAKEEAEKIQQRKAEIKHNQEAKKCMTEQKTKLTSSASSSTTPAPPGAAAAGGTAGSAQKKTTSSVLPKSTPTPAAIKPSAIPQTNVKTPSALNKQSLANSAPKPVQLPRKIILKSVTKRQAIAKIPTKAAATVVAVGKTIPATAASGNDNKSDVVEQSSTKMEPSTTCDNIPVISVPSENNQTASVESLDDFLGIPITLGPEVPPDGELNVESSELNGQVTIASLESDLNPDSVEMKVVDECEC